MTKGSNTYALPPPDPICYTVRLYKKISIQLGWEVSIPAATVDDQPIGKIVSFPSCHTFLRCVRPTSAGFLQVLLVKMNKIEIKITKQYHRSSINIYILVINK